VKGYDLNRDWWVNADGNAPPLTDDPAFPVTGNYALSLTKMKILQCPASPFPNRVQDKKDTAPRKSGATTDYFAVAGIGANFNTLAGLTGTDALTQPSPGVIEEWKNCGTSALRPRNKIVQLSDGTSNTFLVGECAGREDVWRDRVRVPANANQSAPDCARAQGGAWATNDNPYALGDKLATWCNTAGGPTTTPTTAIPDSAKKINGSNDWGWLFYSFHDGAANVAFADGSVRSLSEGTSLKAIGMMASRAGGEVVPE
jgi:prepilin-type processing-associated H-X9-DG protein